MLRRVCGKTSEQTDSQQHTLFMLCHDFECTRVVHKSLVSECSREAIQHLLIREEPAEWVNRMAVQPKPSVSWSDLNSKQRDGDTFIALLSQLCFYTVSLSKLQGYISRTRQFWCPSGEKEGPELSCYQTPGTFSELTKQRSFNLWKFTTFYSQIREDCCLTARHMFKRTSAHTC